jgi:type IV pilus assembly protein PilW
MKTSHSPRIPAGFSLVELMIAMSLGLVLVAAFSNVYLSSRTASRRVAQLSTLQQSVRTAFDYLNNDAHAIGMMGCFTGTDSAITNTTTPAVPDLTNNYGPWVEGYDAATVPSYPLAAASAAANWNTNATGTATLGKGRGIDTIPFATLGTAVTLGSDVLVLRTTVGRPLRITTATINPVLTPNQILLEAIASGGTCTTNTSLSKVSGLCPNSHALIANCTQARAFQVASIGSTGTITIAGTGLTGSANFQQTTTEVFPLQTVVYYVRPSSNGKTQSLYRRVFDGDDGATGTGDEQELIEDVENLQVLYGIDNVTTNADGSPDLTVDSYVTANGVTDWSKVVAVRVALLIRAQDPVGADVTLPASAPVNGVAVTFPTSGAKYDRRVFTTTIALRNKVAY